MSQENVAVVQRAFVAWNTGGFDALASGASVEVENGQVITFRDDKVIRTDVYSGPAEAAQAAGVRLSRLPLA
jgi:hypothetical protein